MLPLLLLLLLLCECAAAKAMRSARSFASDPLLTRYTTCSAQHQKLCCQQVGTAKYNLDAAGVHQLWG
jgi:hypothetical protein